MYLLKLEITCVFFLAFFNQQVKGQSVYSFEDKGRVSGVHSFGKYAGLLQTERVQSVDENINYTISFLAAHKVPEVKFGIPYGFGLEKAVANQHFGVLWFVKNKQSIVVKVDTNSATRLYLNGPKNLRYYGQDRLAMNDDGSIVIVKHYMRSDSLTGRRVDGAELAIIDSTFRLIKHLNNDFKGLRYEVLDILQTNNNFGLVKESYGNEKMEYHLALDIYNYEGQHQRHILLSDSFHYLPNQLYYDALEHSWFVSGVYFTRKRLKATKGLGHFLWKLDSAKNGDVKSLSKWDNVTDIIQRANPPQFIEEKNAPMQLRPAAITKESGGYQLVLESFILTNGLTPMKVALQVQEPWENVLTLKDLVVETYSKQGELISQQVIAKPVASILVTAHFDEVGVVEKWRFFEEQDLFAIKEVDSSSVVFLDPEKENVHLGYLNWKQDSTFRSERVNFIAPDTIIYSKQEQDFINKSKVLRALASLNNKLDTLYAKSEAPAQKAAYSFMKVDYTPNRDQRQLYGLRQIGPTRLFWYEIMQVKQLIYFQYIDLP